jgi:para-aminobenzoate synthetase/4-amino-4-deoxychorismate lyase
VAVRAFLRFDDLTPGSEMSYQFAEAGEVLVATNVREVGPALERVDQLRQAGWWLAGFVSYDAASGVDRGLVVPSGSDGGDLPLVWFAAYRKRVPVGPLQPSTAPGSTALAWVPEVSHEDYVTAIGKIRERIGDGDTCQVNHTFRLRAPFTGDPFDFYVRIALAQRGGYCAFIDTGDHQIASASPERFFSSTGRTIRVKPMKGTMRRGRWSTEDALLAQRLRHSEKERAENLMIVDLLRNDLGRISEFGSVQATRLLDVERYDTVWQLTSEISAVLRSNVGFAEVFGALFPSGSVTGAPKRRTMEIIASLETSARGVYCGAIGYVGPMTDGGLDATFNVAIRTAVIDQGRATVEYGVGGGITWDSTADAEYEEAILKSDVLRVSPAPPALFETLRWDLETGFWLEERHLERLAASASYFGFRHDPAAARDALNSAVPTSSGSRLVRLTLDRHGALEAVVGRSLDRAGTDRNPGPAVLVALAAEAVSSRSVLLFHKTVNRQAYESRKASRPDLEDVILVNERNEVTESTVANLAVLIGDEWVTPALSSGCLPGTFRAELLASGMLTERVVSVEDLVSSDGVALINSVRGWRTAVLVD